ncbi:MAG: molybdenum cofactor guanylyltransferase [Candidatus Bathyarchaeia archaeon]
MRRGAIILAGGQSRRFQLGGKQWIDKALITLSGKPLLVYVIESVIPAVDEIIICVNSQTRKLRYSKVLKHFSIKNVKLFVDKQFTSVKRGPAAAIATGLNASSADHCVILPCDTPFIQPSVVDFMFAALRKACIAVPIHPNGKLETLMMVCQRSTVARISETLCEIGRDRPDDIIRGAPEISYISTINELRYFDPEFKSFININSLEDLNILSTRVTEVGPVRETINLKLGQLNMHKLKLLKITSKYYLHKNFLKALDIISPLSTYMESKQLKFWAGISREIEAKCLTNLGLKLRKSYNLRNASLIKAALNYRLEAEIYDDNKISTLAHRAIKDSLRCQQLIKNKFLT